MGCCARFAVPLPRSPPPYRDQPPTPPSTFPRAAAKASLDVACLHIYSLQPASLGLSGAAALDALAGALALQAGALSVDATDKGARHRSRGRGRGGRRGGGATRRVAARRDAARRGGGKISINHPFFPFFKFCLFP